MTATTPLTSDHRALEAAARGEHALATLVQIDGSFSRRLGAQLAIGRDGSITGSLADGCLERQLVSEAADAQAEGAPRLLRFGAGSPSIDFRLPCGSGLDVAVDPAPPVEACRAALRALDQRRPASLPLHLPSDAAPGLLRERDYIPLPRLALFGEGPELESLARLARASGIATEAIGKDDPQRLSLGRAPRDVACDAWTAIVLLFHDHEWEAPILEWALGTQAFYIGAQGGKPTREARVATLQDAGWGADALARLRSPIGLIGHARDPGVLALSVLAEVVAAYEQLQPHR